MLPNEWQTLQLFVKGISERKGIEKNLWAKKYIKNIEYSKSEILINVFYSIGYKKTDFSFFPAASQMMRGKTLDESSPEYDKSQVRDSIAGSAFKENSNCIPIILPNTIHKCRKYNRWILLENEDGNVCTFMLYSSKSYGIKLGITASDNSSVAKKALIMFHINAFNVVGVIGEISPPLEKVIIDKIPSIKSTHVSTILNKEIMPLADGYHYKRNISNLGTKTKILVGRLKYY